MPLSAWRGELVDFGGDAAGADQGCRHVADGLLLVENGRIVAYRVIMRVSFLLE